MLKVGLLRLVAASALALLMACTAACNKKKDDPRPGSSNFRLLVGDGGKRWFFHTQGAAYFPYPVNLDRAMNVDISQDTFSDCEQDDALVFRTDYTMDYWNGPEACSDNGFTNAMTDQVGWWYLYLDQQSMLLNSHPSNGFWYLKDKVWHVAELTETRLRVRIIQDSDSLTSVHQMVFESQP